ncbi:hypothetical protein HR45_08590 [Shewanella mangrovi]|uniref:Lipoprotein n=1 Tax=Shewanella mangrovi TaxID=1515746 RepID=A0A094JZT5_9GAMM|nr:hypothetical protein [Shewanella mangrovi]KFZ37891.1 hypothetical protein HR45_08590 [Shewanella mangrovi]
MAIRTSVLTLSPVLFTMLLAGCGDSVKGQFTDAEICRASVATALNKAPKLFNVEDVNGKVVYLTHYENDDWQRDIYRCKLEGTKVLWATEKGPWKNTPADNTLTFAANDDKLTIMNTDADGQQTDKHFKFDQLKVDTPTIQGLKG